MFCPNCSNVLQAVGNPELLSQDLLLLDYWTHQCSVCSTYWHAHLVGEQAILIATTHGGIASDKIIADLKAELEKRISDLTKRPTVEP